MIPEREEFARRRAVAILSMISAWQRYQRAFDKAAKAAALDDYRAKQADIPTVREVQQ